MSLDEILVAVKAYGVTREDPWTALLYHYVDRANGSDKHAGMVDEILGRAIASISENVHSAALYGGFTGVAWLATHLTEIVAGDEDPNEEIDATLRTLLERAPWHSDYDLIGGLVGIGVYFLERLKFPNGAAGASACLELTVERLAELATYSSAGAAWHTPAAHLPQWQREFAPKGYYNLGVAHGIPGVIALLGQVCEAKVGGARSLELLGQSVDWLLAQPPTKGLARFPAWRADEKSPNATEGSRLAWCYGDLGISAALLRAARCVGEPHWEREAIEIGLNQAATRGDHAMAYDAGLCHGTAGIAHLFNRMFQATGNAIFGGAARYWFERTLEMRHPGAGIAGYRKFRPDGGELRWEDATGFLEGAAGIGLGLLGATSNVEPNWDCLLLVSVPPRVVPSSTPPLQ